ncbi:hypothetical protein MRX96_052353, partial [Rhipicephalus microplus]
AGKYLIVTGSPGGSPAARRFAALLAFGEQVEAASTAGLASSRVGDDMVTIRWEREESAGGCNPRHSSGSQGTYAGAG